MSIDVCIGNYGYYNEGELRDAWISLPKTTGEIRDFLSAQACKTRSTRRSTYRTTTACRSASRVCSPSTHGSMT